MNTQAPNQKALAHHSAIEHLMYRSSVHTLFFVFIWGVVNREIASGFTAPLLRSRLVASSQDGSKKSFLPHHSILVCCSSRQQDQVEVSQVLVCTWAAVSVCRLWCCSKLCTFYTHIGWILDTCWGALMMVSKVSIEHVHSETMGVAFQWLSFMKLDFK